MTITVRVRRGLAAVVLSTAAWAGPADPVLASGTYVVVPGDGFYAIAAATGADLGAILDANGLRLDSVIHPGQRLTIPDAGSTATAPPQPTRQATPRAPSPTSGTVTVRAGDGLYAVAQRAGVSLQRLLTANGLTLTSIIHPGQRLAIPGTAPSSTTPTQASSAPAPASALALPRDVADPSLVAVFRRAASEAGVPADLLMAVCYR